MIIDVEGIIINSKDYKDSSKILDIFTKDYGVIGVIAKGCKSLKSNLRSVTDKLTYATFTIYYKKDKLSILSEASFINNFSNIKKDIEKISHASFLIDLTNQVYKQCEDNTLYSLLISALEKIDEKFNPLVITNIIELKYLEYLGVLPILDSCSICGSKTNIVTLSGSRGGFICRNCLTNDVIVSEKTMKLIIMFFYVDIEKIDRLEISDKSQKEINDFLDSYYELYTGLYLKTKYLLNKIKR